MTDVIPIDPGSWESDGEVVPIGGLRDLDRWIEVLEREGASWDEAGTERAPWRDGYAVVIAARSPHPRPTGTIRYFLIGEDDVRALPELLGERAGRLVRQLGASLSPTLGAAAVRALGLTAGRWADAWGRAFVGIDQVAGMAGVERATVEAWAREHDDFPLTVVERARGPVYVREEIEEWLARRKS